MPIKNEKIAREIKNVQSAGKRQKNVKIGAIICQI
jgi:hypothetical protein